MTKNKIHCLIIKEPKSAEHSLTGMFDNWESKISVAVIDNTPNNIIKKLLSGNISLVFTCSNNKQELERYRNLLRRYSNDTILINQSVKNRPLLRDLSGIESASIYSGDVINSPVIMHNLLSYAQMKRDFRQCKHLLSITDQRNRWLVNITHEPIAYLYKSTHIHANAAYLSIFGFQSIAELKSTTIWDLVPDKSLHMFKNFIKKQRRNMDMKQTLLMTMNTTDNTQIRTGIRIAPAVLNKTKCLQLWVHKIQEGLSKVEHKLERHDNKKPVSPWENLPEKKTSSNPDMSIKKEHRQSRDKQPRNAADKLPDKLNRNISAVKLRLQRLTDTHTKAIEYYLVSLAFDGLDQAGISSQLKNSGVTNIAIFWDRLLLSKLSRELSNNHQAENQYILSLTAASFNNDQLMSFLLKTIKALSKNHPHIVFLAPLGVYKDSGSGQRIAKIKKILLTMNCSLGVYNVIPDKLSLQNIMRHKPSYLAFSSSWVDKISANTKGYEKLVRLTENLEKTGIQVILS